MNRNTRGLRTTLAIVYTAWILYEAYMALRLGGEIRLARDYAALTIKLSYLIIALALLAGGRDPLKEIPIITPYPIIVLRLIGSWLSYSWYTLLAPLLATAEALIRLRRARTSSEGRLLTVAVAGNTLLALLMLPGLITNLYNPPARPDPATLAAVPTVIVYTLALAKSGRLTR